MNKFLVLEKNVLTLRAKAVGGMPSKGNRVRIPDSPAAVSLYEDFGKNL